MEYRRSHTPGGSFFFTLVTENRRPIFASKEAVAVLREAMRHVKNSRPFDINAAVIFPDHIHCIWTLPPDDADFSTRWRLIKTWFTKHCDPSLRDNPNRVRTAKGGQSIWQQRYWEHQLRDEQDFIRHVEYIHFNPVKHGLVASVNEWPYSSFHRYVDEGNYPSNWGADVVEYLDVGRE
ncbi:MAG: transposase [Desulfuromonas sp.]|nr:transposase [Desulfuromonas sp.]